MMTRRMVAMVAATGLLLISACGGGGSDGPVTGGQELTVAEFREAVRDEVLDATSQMRSSFGSVIVATGNVSSLDTTFDGQRATVTIGRRGINAIRLDTANAYNNSTAPSLIGSGRTWRTQYVYADTVNSATLGLISVDWANNDPNDYLAGGYWLHAELNPISLDVGAFVEGPELSLSEPPTLPVSGTATYRGPSSGLYASEYGSDFPGVPVGSHELGEFNATATLAANFGFGTIEGRVNDVTLSGYYYDNVSGQVTEFANVPTDYQLHLGSVSINRNNATFQGSDVRASSQFVDISQSSGAWAGQFSNRLNGAGDPRLVAGTFGGSAETRGGTRTAFVGAFAAAHE